MKLLLFFTTLLQFQAAFAQVVVPSTSRAPTIDDGMTKSKYLVICSVGVVRSQVPNPSTINIKKVAISKEVNDDGNFIDNAKLKLVTLDNNNLSVHSFETNESTLSKVPDYSLTFSSSSFGNISWHQELNTGRMSYEEENVYFTVSNCLYQFDAKIPEAKKSLFTWEDIFNEGDKKMKYILQCDVDDIDSGETNTSFSDIKKVAVIAELNKNNSYKENILLEIRTYDKDLKVIEHFATNELSINPYDATLDILPSVGSPAVGVFQWNHNNKLGSLLFKSGEKIELLDCVHLMRGKAL